MMDHFQLQVPRYENPFSDNRSLDDIEREVSEKLAKDGFCVIDFPLDDIESISNRLVNKLTKFFKDESDDGKIHPGQRIQDAIDIDEINLIAGNKRIIEILSNVYGKTAFPFQTLNFPAGTEQSSHSDHVHFDSIPKRFMAGVWLALEDITEENGPLFYYPGSHNWPALYNTEVGFHQTEKSAPHYNRFPIAWDQYAKKLGVKKQYFFAKKGQCLIWASNLVHGGSPQKDRTLTRMSQVTHYYFNDCAYYTPVLSNPEHGDYHWREIYDLFSKSRKPNVINGHEVGKTRVESISGNFKFDPNLYLELNPDVRAAGANPYEHYLTFGIHEGRRVC